MNEQQTIPPGYLEWQCEHLGYQVWRASDGVYEAYKTTSTTVSHIGVTRSGQEKEVRVGTAHNRIILPAETLPGALKMLEERIKKKPSQKIVRINTAQTKLGFDEEA